MGTWEGHISPGVAFYSFGIVFCFQYSREYLRKGKKTKESERRQKTSKLGTVFIKIKRFPLDAFLKILYGFGAAMAELFYPPGTNKLYMVYPTGEWAHLDEWQHFTMYMSFAVSGMIDIISQKVMKKRNIVLEKSAVAVAFYLTSILLFYHKHGKHELEQEGHELLLYAALMMCAVLTAEIWRPFDVRLTWAQTVLVMQSRSVGFKMAEDQLKKALQWLAIEKGLGLKYPTPHILACELGSWLFHLAFILFPKKGQEWDPKDTLNGMVLPIFFCWHVFLNLTVLSLIFLSQYLYFKFWKINLYHAVESRELQSCCRSRDSDDSDCEAPLAPSSKHKTSYTRNHSDQDEPLLSETETTYA